MLNQSFNSEEFQEIFDKENRKGKNIEDRFKNEFKESLSILKNIKIINSKLKSETDLEKRRILLNDKSTLQTERRKEISKTLDIVAKKIFKIKKINLQKGGIYGKQSYLLENSIENFFISKKIQNNLFSSYNIKQANRFTVLSQLINLLEDGFPKYVIRTDIESFYESIPQKMLRDKINDDYLLSTKTKGFINLTLDSYNELTTQNDLETAKGIPRGVGFSAYLAELFMRKIDNSLRQISDLYYYCRYVDDIIMIFIPKSIHVSQEYLKNYESELKQIVIKESKNFLKLNQNKTNVYNLLKGYNNISLKKPKPNFIDFLGYKIGSCKRNNKQDVIIINLSDKKIQKYKDKIRAAFTEFKIKKKTREKEAYKLLKARVEYLTHNTKLRNNKNKVFIGIYYSNPFLNSSESLLELQKYLRWYIQQSGLSIDKKNELYKFDFVENYNKKKFIFLPLKNKIYKNHNNKSQGANKGVLQYGLTEINSIW